MFVENIEKEAGMCVKSSCLWVSSYSGKETKFDNLNQVDQSVQKTTNLKFCQGSIIFDVIESQKDLNLKGP